MSRMAEYVKFNICRCWYVTSDMSIICIYIIICVFTYRACKTPVSDDFISDVASASLATLAILGHAHVLYGRRSRCKDGTAPYTHIAFRKSWYTYALVMQIGLGLMHA